MNDILKEKLEANESIIFKNPDYTSALVGMTIDGRAVYDYDLMVEYLMSTEDIEYTDALDFIEYNTVRSLPYIENGPIIVRLDYGDAND